MGAVAECSEHGACTIRLTRLVTSDYISRCLSDMALVLGAPMSEASLEMWTLVARMVASVYHTIAHE